MSDLPDFTQSISAVIEAGTINIDGPVSVINDPNTTILTTQTQFTAASQVATTNNTATSVLDFTTISYPGGTDADNFHTAIVAVHDPSHPVNAVVWLTNANGSIMWFAVATPLPDNPNYGFCVLPLVEGTGSSPAHPQVWVNPGLTSTLVVDVSLTQISLTPPAIFTGTAPWKSAIGSQSLSVTGVYDNPNSEFTYLSGDDEGRAYSVSVPPSAAANEHPVNELQVAFQDDKSATTVLVAAPGAGKRLRLFGHEVICHTLSSGRVFVSCSFDSGAVLSLCSLAVALERSEKNFLPSGLAMDANTAVTLTISGTATASATVYYTTETV